MKVGIFGIGLNTYWKQFEGLLPRLEGYLSQIAENIAGNDCEVVNAGLVDDPFKAQTAAAFLHSENIEMAFLYVSTYALSSTVLPIVRVLNVPVIILNLQPTAAIDYDYINSMNDAGHMTGEWLANCQACSVPEIACVMNRMGLRYEIVTGCLTDDSVWQQLAGWIKAAKVKYAMRKSRMGVLGHYYNGMLDVYSDLTALSGVFGTHFELLEMCRLKELRDKVSEEEIHNKLDEFNTAFEVMPDCEEQELIRAAKTSVALDKMVEESRISSMAYYYEGASGNDYEDIVTSFIAGSTLLTGKNIPVAGECEVKNALAMQITALLGAGGSFSEPYAMDFNDDVVLWGHDGPAHFAIAEGRVKLVSLPVYHGKPGKGLSIQMSVKHGDVTLLSVVEGRDGIFLLVAEGESVAGKVLNIGNTNSRYRFPVSAKDFMDNWAKAGPSHHCSIGVGHLASDIKKLCFLLGIPICKIC
ncbi:MAG: L-fucose/L-arabinose isomerase family protein [Prolixibacteraceae bacterium]|nr:L-fucose/L-arabinose isomerase family protein [Prolixibacteraceae bacterium]